MGKETATPDFNMWTNFPSFFFFFSRVLVGKKRLELSLLRRM